VNGTPSIESSWVVHTHQHYQPLSLSVSPSFHSLSLSRFLSGRSLRLPLAHGEPHERRVWHKSVPTLPVALAQFYGIRVALL